MLGGDSSSTVINDGQSVTNSGSLTVDEVLKRFVEAIGGTAANKAVNSRVTKGTLDITGVSRGGSFESYGVAPNKSFTLIQAHPLGTVKLGFNGRTGWASTAGGKRLLKGAELAKVQRSGITERELARAKNSIRAGFLDRLAGVLGKAELINGYNYFVGTPDWVRQDAARYDALTTADVQRVARQYLAQPKVVLTVVPEGQRAMALRAGATPATPAAGVRP